VVSGVSVGAINSASFALFAKGDERKLGEYIIDLWENMKNEFVWKFRNNVDPVGPLFNDAGFVDDSPMFDFLYGKFTDFANIARRTVITTANDVITGNQMTYVIREEANHIQSAEWRSSVVKGSASVPFVFPPTSMK